MLTRIAAQALVDGFAALTLAATAIAPPPASARQALRPRLAFALVVLCLFYGLRTAFLIVGVDRIDTVVLVCASVLPLAALLLVEGMLRRHAPGLLKIFVVAGGVVVAGFALFGREEPISLWVFGIYEVGALSTLAGLLLLRHRSSLSQQENAELDALLGAGALLAAVSVTDFLANAPVGMSGLGVAVIAVLARGAPATARDARRAFALPAILALLGAGAAAILAPSLGLTETVAIERMAAVFTALLLAAAAVQQSLTAGDAAATTVFAAALARADATDLERLLGALANQPLLAGLRIMQGPQLCDYGADALSVALHDGPARRGARGRDHDSPRGREQIEDLMARTDSTHALMLSRAPLRIGLLTLAPGQGGEQTEAHLALFQRLALQANQKVRPE